MYQLTDDPDINPNDYLLAKNMADTLHKHYPGHMWAVSVDGKAGIATVRNMALTGSWGFILKLDELQHDPTMKSVMRAGGEVLERYNLRRGRMVKDDLDEIPLNKFGQCVAEISDLAPRFRSWLK